MPLDNKFIFVAGNQPRCEIVVYDGDDKMAHAANLLQQEIEKITHVKVKITDKAENISQVEIGTLSNSPEIRKVLEKDKILSISGDLNLLLASTASTHIFIPDDLGKQGFVIYKTSAGSGRLLLTGNTSQACLYAVFALIDRLHLEDDKLIVDKLNTRLLPTVNIPAFEYRSIATNIGGPDWLGHNQWVKEWGNQNEYDYRGFIDWLASHKINHLNLWLFNLAFGIAYDSPRFPECVNRHHPNVKNEFISDMIEYAHKRHIEIFVFVDFPDNWTAIVKAHPNLAGKNVDTAALLHTEEEKWETYQKYGEVSGERFRANSWVCASNPKTMEFWEEYWDELLDRYPGIDGIGGQFEEHRSYRCDCANCAKSFFQLQWKFFKRMSEIANQKNPDIKLWAYRSWGARDILKNRDKLPQKLIWIDWGGQVQPFLVNKSTPRGDWYLYHRSREQWYEYGQKQSAMVCHQNGINGFQMRGFDGTLDEIKLWRAALTQAEVQLSMIGKLGAAVSLSNALPITWGQIKDDKFIRH
ncbi:MAG: family 20 glycosylhydrolase [Candidatus Poribacteria bacterium]